MANYVSLADLITAGKWVRATCPRCSGNVTVPTEVTWHDRRNIYMPQGQCHRCGVTWAWQSDKNPVTGNTSVRSGDKGLTNVWYCDRVMDAPAPSVVEVQ